MTPQRSTTLLVLLVTSLFSTLPGCSLPEEHSAPEEPEDGAIVALDEGDEPSVEQDVTLSTVEHREEDSDAGLEPEAEPQPAEFNDDPQESQTAPVAEMTPPLGPMVLTSVQMPLTRAPQGMIRLSANYFLVSQDVGGPVAFYLAHRDGRVMRSWKFSYHTHAQTLAVIKRTTGYDVFTSTDEADGVAKFNLSLYWKTMTFSGKTIVPKNAVGGKASGTIGFDVANDAVAVCGYFKPSGPGKEARGISFYRLSDYLKGKLVSIGKTVRFEDRLDGLGPVQGCAMSEGRGYMALGDGYSLKQRKYLYRVDLTTQAVKRYEMKTNKAEAISKYEPEGISVQNGMLNVGIFSDKAQTCRPEAPCSGSKRFYRIYAMPVF